MTVAPLNRRQALQPGSTLMLSRLICPLLLVFLARNAAAQPPGDDARSPVEPGTLAQGEVGVRAGASLGSGPTGLGVELIVGLGGLDLMGGLGWTPNHCIAIGGLGSGCDEGETFLHLGVQGAFKEWRGDRTRLGARAQFDYAIRGDDEVNVGAGALVVSTGSGTHRFLGEALTVRYEEQGDPFDKNGFYTGVAVGYQVLGKRWAGFVLMGTVFPVEGQKGPLLVGSVGLLWK
jgi:hypothetical protein